MKRRIWIRNTALSIPGILLSSAMKVPDILQGSDEQKLLTQPFEPNWTSLERYKVPEWYRNAKLGFWAHWGPQCQPEAGDWYARGMYQEGSWQYKYHLEKYGHPSVFGFKDVINTWKADQWDPFELVGLYKNSGAQYFMAMANHHDNFDMFDSRYQPNWNSVKIGPQKDIIGGWAKAANKHQLPFGVSIHGTHAWSWYETAQRADKLGPKAGVPYDGKLTLKDGKGLWWEGIDPQELYSQNHELSRGSSEDGTIHTQWNWGNGVTPPSLAYQQKFYNRIVDLINKYSPDVLYFDDSQLPFWPISNIGLKIAAYHYNKSVKDYGALRAVINGKILDEQQRKAIVWDIERGQSNTIESLPWQTDTCIGNWHYDRAVYENKGYKSAQTVIHTLIDIVSKNGNLMLNIPVRGNGTIDEEERKVVEGIGRWMKLNNESIYETRPWKIYGEGPAQEHTVALSAQGFNEGQGKLFSAQDIRFCVKKEILYATALGWPNNGSIVIKALSDNNELYPKTINKVELVSTGESLSFKRTGEGLIIEFPTTTAPENYANALRIF